MSLLEEARAHILRPGVDCNIQVALKAHPELVGEIRELISARDIPNTVASRTLADRDIVVRHDTIGRHRRNDCACCTARGVTW